MSDYLIDTGILIRYFRKVEGYRDLLDTLAQDDLLYISAMTRLEIVRGMRDREREPTFELLNSLETVVINSEIADGAGELIRSWQSRGMMLGDADAIIASTAIQNGLALVTTNAKHFPMSEMIVFQVDEHGKLTLRE
jgi:tRNA(fMet)-specific endonuclease VapC